MQDLGDELRGRRYGNGELRPDEFWAVKDVNFELKRGECLGLIGHNGAGKTTLLRMLNGLIKPDQGVIEMRGRVGALIALGAGFNPILTGRENIYTNASVLGLSKRQVDQKFEEILDFAEIGDFIDMPVQNYSSGMSVRLGFAVAAVLIEPDILFLDEVLAVGDIGFAIKCLNVVRRLTQNSAVVFVSHNMQFISSFCTRIILMHHGNVMLESSIVSNGIDQYYQLITTQSQIFGSGEAAFTKIDLIVNGLENGDAEPIVMQGSELVVRTRVRVSESSGGAHMLVSLNSESMTPVLCSPLQDTLGEMFTILPGEHEFTISLGVMDLNSGKYLFGFALSDVKDQRILISLQNARPFSISSDKKYWGFVIRPAVPRFIQNSCA